MIVNYQIQHSSKVFDGGKWYNLLPGKLESIDSAKDRLENLRNAKGNSSFKFRVLKVTEEVLDL